MNVPSAAAIHSLTFALAAGSFDSRRAEESYVSQRYLFPDFSRITSHSPGRLFWGGGIFTLRWHCSPESRYPHP